MNDKTIILSTQDERIQYILKKHYQKDKYVLIDDLFILTLDKVKESEVKIVLYVPSLIVSNEAIKTVNFYKNHYESFEISSKLFSRLASKENCTGILVLTKIKMFDETKMAKDSLILVCDGLEIAGNIGTIFRTAESCQIDLIIFTNIKARVPSDLLVKASRGMIFYVPFLICENTYEALLFLKNSSIKPIICEPEQGTDFTTYDYNKNQGIALIVGNERYGVDKAWFTQECDYIKIPMYGKMDSLNVAVAASLLIYQAKAQRNKLNKNNVK